MIEFHLNDLKSDRQDLYCLRKQITRSFSCQILCKNIYYRFDRVWELFRKSFLGFFKTISIAEVFLVGLGDYSHFPDPTSTSKSLTRSAVREMVNLSQSWIKKKSSIYCHLLPSHSAANEKRKNISINWLLGDRTWPNDSWTLTLSKRGSL